MAKPNLGALAKRPWSCEKRLEYAPQILRRNAFAGVAHGQADMIARARFRILPDTGSAAEARSDVHGEKFAALGMASPGVDGQIKQDLLQHAGVGLDQREAGARS